MFSVNTIESLAFVNAPYLYENICLVYPLTVGNVLSLQEKIRYCVTNFNNR